MRRLGARARDLGHPPARRISRFLPILTHFHFKFTNFYQLLPISSGFIPLISLIYIALIGSLGVVAIQAAIPVSAKLFLLSSVQLSSPPTPRVTEVTASVLKHSTYLQPY